MFKPVLDYLLIDEIKAARSGGIVLPENVTFEWVQGRVMAVGPGKRTITGELIAPDYDIGDVVVFSGQAAMDIEVGDEKIKLIGSNNVLGVMEAENGDE